MPLYICGVQHIANLLFFSELKVCVFVPKLRTKDSSFVGVFLVPLSCSWS